MTPTKSGARAPRSKVESFADWMARVDAEVDWATRRVERRLPGYVDLHSAQRRIVQMFMQYLLALPELGAAESHWEKRAYDPINQLLRDMFVSKYPKWERTPRTPGGHLDINLLPDGEAAIYSWMLRNCAGRAPEEMRAPRKNDDEEDD